MPHFSIQDNRLGHKVRSLRLLAARTPYEEERDAATAKAQDLMSKYQVDEPAPETETLFTHIFRRAWRRQ